MAQRILLLDDIDGSEGASPHRLVLDDTTWDLDLGEANLAKLQKALQPFTSKGREKVRASSNGTGDAAKVREWAKANGHQIGEKGRIPEDVQAAYDAANAQPAT